MSVSLVIGPSNTTVHPTALYCSRGAAVNLRDNPREPRYGEGVTEAHQKLPALERAMKAVMVEKHQALLNVRIPLKLTVDSDRN